MNKQTKRELQYACNQIALSGIMHININKQGLLINLLYFVVIYGFGISGPDLTDLELY